MKRIWLPALLACGLAVGLAAPVSAQHRLGRPAGAMGHPMAHLGTVQRPFVNNFAANRFHSPFVRRNPFVVSFVSPDSYFYRLNLGLALAQQSQNLPFLQRQLTNAAILSQRSGNPLILPNAYNNYALGILGLAANPYAYNYGTPYYGGGSMPSYPNYTASTYTPYYPGYSGGYGYGYYPSYPYYGSSTFSALSASNIYGGTYYPQTFYQSPPGSIYPIGGGYSTTKQPYSKTGSESSTYQPNAQNRGVVVVKVPSANALVWFNGKLDEGNGAVRVFQTPELAAGKSYEYPVRVTFMRGGQPVTQDRTVTVTAGNRAVLDFTK